MNILLLDHGRQSLPFIQSLYKAGHKVTLVCLSRLSEGYFSVYPAKRLIWPNYNTDKEGFKNALIHYVKTWKPEITLALGDVSSEIIANNREEILKYTKITVPPESVYYMAKDKNKTMAFCMDQKIPCPKTYNPEVDHIDSIAKCLSFPVVVKPARGLGAIGLRRFYSAEELLCYLRSLNGQLKNLLIQEFIPHKNGMQYQAEAFLDSNSKVKICLVIEKPRFFPLTGGTSTANVTVYRPDIVETTRQLLEGIKWVGAADVDYILDPRDGIPKVIEINPRVTAGIKIGFAAGINYADLHIRLANGAPIPEMKDYKLGVYSRNIIMDLLWYFKASREMRQTTSPSFFKFFGPDIVYQTFSLKDPLTGIGFTLGMLKKFSQPGKWKEKMGKSLN